MKRQRGSKLNAYHDMLKQTNPNMAKMLNIDIRYGGKPKAGQLVREGHYPKFSELID